MMMMVTMTYSAEAEIRQQLPQQQV